MLSEQNLFTCRGLTVFPLRKPPCQACGEWLRGREAGISEALTEGIQVRDGGSLNQNNLNRDGDGQTGRRRDKDEEWIVLNWETGTEV